MMIPVRSRKDKEMTDLNMDGEYCAECGSANCVGHYSWRPGQPCRIDPRCKRTWPHTGYHGQEEEK